MEGADKLHGDTMGQSIYSQFFTNGGRDVGGDIIGIDVMWGDAGGGNGSQGRTVSFLAAMANAIIMMELT
ncbi:MAG: hypothetical protein F6K11_23910 [Leptolyngbya sp. SIO3F4]|nr:hypothetical protein [Leptolyngbya sp. SIO3F4]